MFLLFLPFFGHGATAKLGGGSAALAQKGTRISVLTRLGSSAQKALSKKRAKIDDIQDFLRARKKNISKQQLIADDLIDAEVKIDELAKELKSLQKIKQKREDLSSLTPEQRIAAEKIEIVADTQIYGMTLDQKIDSVQKKFLRAEKDFQKVQARLLSEQIHGQEKEFAALIAQKEALKKTIMEHEKTLQSRGFSEHVKIGARASMERYQRQFDELASKIRDIQNQEAQLFESELPKGIVIPENRRVAMEALKPFEEALSTKKGKLFLQTETGRQWLINTKVGKYMQHNTPFIVKWIKNSPDGIRFRLVKQSKDLLDELFAPIKIGKGFYDSIHMYLNNFFRFKTDKFKDLEELFKQADAQKIFYKTDEYFTSNEVEQIRLAKEIFEYQKQVMKARALESIPTDKPGLFGHTKTIYPQGDMIEGFLTSDVGKQLLKTKQGQEWLNTSAGQAWLGTETGEKWLQTAEGKKYLKALTKELTEFGQAVAS